MLNRDIKNVSQSGFFPRGLCQLCLIDTNKSQGFCRPRPECDTSFTLSTVRTLIQLRVCFVEGRGTYRKADKHCPTLEQNSNIECIIGLDRLDCLRRIHKGTAHFGVFSSEDLVTARWAGVEVLVTSEMRFHNTPFEYEIVAVVSNEANINSANELRGSRLCHPGHGLQESHLTEILANYFESTLVARQCEADISLVESRIKASADFFGPSCKAGPWVPDAEQDRALKRRYRSLCELCYEPQTCGTNDKFWGRRGPLYCLSGGYGDVAWARLDDVKAHFGFSGLPAETDPAAYSYLCPDGHLQPLHVQHPCTWVAKPWPAIAARREYADRIQSLVGGLTHDNDRSWQNALLSLLETYHVNITTLDTSIPIDDYLDQAVGFQSAYSFPSCSPPRSVVYCTTSLLQHFKCSWLQEAAAVYGIEPNIQCVRTESVERCMEEVHDGVADIMMADQDERVPAQTGHQLRPLMYEYAANGRGKYVVVAVVRADSALHGMPDLRGRPACFGAYEGAAHVSVWQTLTNLSLIATAEQQCTPGAAVAGYFGAGSQCASSNAAECPAKYAGDEGALRCLAEGAGEVAFVDLAVFQNLTAGAIAQPWVSGLSQVRLLCPFGLRAKFEKDPCYLHWTPRGHLMVRADLPQMRRNEIYNSLREMDKLFGKQYKQHTIPFTMYGPFDRRNNVMFRDGTDGLRSLDEMRSKDRWPRMAEEAMTAFVAVNNESGGGQRAEACRLHSAASALGSAWTLIMVAVWWPVFIVLRLRREV